MIKNLNFSNFLDEFPETYRNNFTYEGKQALFDYLEEYEDAVGEQLTLDVIALCCEYSEYSTAWEAMENYQPDDMPTEGEDGDDLLEIQVKKETASLEWLQNKTQVIEFNGGVIIQDF